MTDPKNIDLNKDGYADADLNRDGIVTEEEIELYRKHVVHYFDTQMMNQILALEEKNKFKYFEMMEKYSDILELIFHKGVPIVEHILYGDEFYSAKLDPHEGIDWTPSEIVKQYIEWKEKK
jgi:hypothetical protein